MKYKMYFTGAAAALLTAAMLLQVPDLREQVTAFGSEEEETVSSFSISPGYPGLPYADGYGDYQWALLNNGMFKLVQGKKVSIEDELVSWLNEQKKKADKPGPAKESGGITLSVPGIDINVVPAWKLYADKANKRKVTVAVVDTGVDYRHEDLWNSMWINEDEIPGDGIDNDNNGFADDIYGWNFYSDNNQIYVGSEDNHGTHAAGTIAAARNGKGIVGIGDSDYIKIMSLKCLGTEAGVGTPENVARAIRYAEANGAVICNLSFGTSRYNEELYQTIKNSKMLFVVAAGNGDKEGQGYNIDEKPVYPASFDLDNVIAVANLRLDGKLDPESNYGLKNVDLAAPGSYILSTVTSNSYSYMSGTSMAAPMVTGAAAMIYSYSSKLQPWEIKGKILSTVRKYTGLEGKTMSGGMLDVAAALNSVAE